MFSNTKSYFSLKIIFPFLLIFPLQLLIAGNVEKSRDQIPEKYKWNLNDLYSSLDKWNNAKEKVESRLDKIETFKGKLDDSAQNLFKALDYYFTNEVHQIGELYCTSQASFIHLGEDKNYSELFRKEIWRGQSNLRSLRGRKIVLREIPSILTPLWQVFFLFGALLAVLWGTIAILLFCLVMLALPSILYAVRLYKTGKDQISFIDALRFYTVYQSARVIGTIIGVFRIIRI